MATPTLSATLTAHDLACLDALREALRARDNTSRLPTRTDAVRSAIRLAAAHLGAPLPEYRPNPLPGNEKKIPKKVSKKA